MNTIIKLDTRGRLVIPSEFRESLAIKEGDNILLSLDVKTNTMTLSPIYGKPKDLIKIAIEFGDTPGCLAKIAEKIAQLKIDLIMTESKSSQRGKKARWDIVADISRCTNTISEIKQKLLQSGYVESISLNKITHDNIQK